jgi:alpha/beta superfamily hydrolase
MQASHPDGFIIFGHSIGAWMVLQHLKPRTADEVPLAVLAMPCFGKSFFVSSNWQDFSRLCQLWL